MPTTTSDPVTMRRLWRTALIATIGARSAARDRRRTNRPASIGGKSNFASGTSPASHPSAVPAKLTPGPRALALVRGGAPGNPGAGRPPAGDDDPPRRRSAYRAVPRADDASVDEAPALPIEISTPTATSDTISDEPPKDMKGSGTPVMGRTPVTAPRLMSAWSPIHAVMPPARIRPNASGARRAIR